MLLGILDLDMIAEKLKVLDRFVMDVLGVRLTHGGLSGWVAESKRKKAKNGVYPKRRQVVENERIELMKKWAAQIGIDQNFAAGLMYTLMSESCRIQDDIMVEKIEKHEVAIDEGDRAAVRDYQRQNLLGLTEAVAPYYDKGYGEGFFGSKLYFAFEKKIIQKLISCIPSKNLAIDFGCATGMISFEIAHAFQLVKGYDISPHMIECAKRKITNKHAHVTFEVHDIEKGIKFPENSVSLAVMNMGTASEIRNFKDFLKNLHKCLAPDGKFFLSFYNSESLLSKIGFIPWPVPLAAHIDSERHCLEVQHDKNFYFLYARSRTVKEVTDLLSDFEIENIYTFPTLGSLLPNVLMETEDKGGVVHPNNAVRKTIENIDYELSKSTTRSGTYIIVTGGKKNVA